MAVHARAFGNRTTWALLERRKRLPVSRACEASDRQVDPADRDLVELSGALARRPGLRLGVEHGWYRDPEAVRRRAADVIAETPHPPGHRSASRLSWGQGEHMSALSEGDIQLMVQANAMCDWLFRALACAEAGELPPVVRIVLGDVPRWPAMRGSRYERDVPAAVEAVGHGDLARLRDLVARCRPPR